MITGAVMAALRTKFAALPELSGVEVYIALPLTADDAPDLVLIGHDGDLEGETTATVEYEWANLACTSRYEIGSIPCAVISQTGDEQDMQGRYDRVQVLLAAMENALVTDINTGGSLAGLVMGATITSGSPRPIQNQAGASVLAPFTVMYRAQV
jgi:hypothetical protein